MRISHLDAGIGWKRLAKTLQAIEKVINTNSPVRGHRIIINETETGSIISVDPKTSDDQNNQNNNGPTGGQWLAVDVVDTSCNRTTIWVWGSTTNPNA